tara:strand:+ start:2869 stop:3483 length:615 start_codon:yes stop_codon:yes gene_type:complete
MSSTWGQITSNAAQFWDGVGGFWREANEAVDEAIDWVTQPRKLLQDSEGNYFGFVSSEDIKKAAGENYRKQQEGSRGASEGLFSNIGTTAMAGASGDYQSAIRRIQATEVPDLSPSISPRSIPYEDELRAANIDVDGISKRLFDAANGDVQNQVISQSVLDEVTPTILIEDNGDNAFIKNYDTGVVQPVEARPIIESFQEKDKG